MSERLSFVTTPPPIAELMVRLTTLEQPDAKILDSGCGRGVFIKELLNRGFTSCVGIELDKTLSDECKKAFSSVEIINTDFLSYTPDCKFDLIIGNPPYAHFRNLPQDIQNEVRYITKTSKSDIYYAFILKSLELLNDNGELIYIVPYHFFYNTHAKYVRKKLLESGKFEIIIDLDELRIFKGENPETIIFRYRKGTFDLKNEKIEVLNIKLRNIQLDRLKNAAVESLQNKCDNDIFSYTQKPHFLSHEIWTTYPSAISFHSSIRLKDIARVGVGLVSGFDKAFLITDEEVKKLTESEKSLVWNFIKSKNCIRYKTDGFSKYIVIDKSIRTEEELQKCYPNIYSKLVKFKDKMKTRYLPNDTKWFQWQALRNFKFLKNNINRKRIYVPALDRHEYNRFSLGPEGLLPSGDVLFIQPNHDDDLYFLLGFLNTKIFRKYYFIKGGRRGKRISFTQRLLEHIEIPEISPELKNKIISIVKKILTSIDSTSMELENQIEELIRQLIVEK